MRKHWLATVAGLLTGTGLASGQTPAHYTGPQPGGFDQLMAANGKYAPQPTIPPSIPLAGPGPGGQLPLPDAPIYPPPANFELADANFGGGGGGDPAREAPHYWANFEYLLWFPKSQPVNFPILTTSSQAANGILNAGNTTVLLGNRDMSFNVASGYKVGFGWFNEPDRRKGFQLQGFFLDRETADFRVNGDAFGNPVIARPFFNVATGLQDSILISSAGTVAGSALVETNTRTFGVEGNKVINLFRSAPDANCWYNLNMVYGFRYADLQERMQVTSASTLLTGDALAPAFGGITAASGGRQIIQDSFRTHNMFFGGTVGFEHEFRYGRLVVHGVTKLSVGDMHQRLEIKGSTEFQSIPGTSAGSSVIGGVLANGSNIGRDRNDVLALVPEFSVNIGYQFTPRVMAYIGYNFLYMNNVNRPGDLEISNADPGLIPGAATFGDSFGGNTIRPDLFRQSDFYVQGATIGFLIRY